MGLLDMVRAAVPGALAARTGYLQGQDAERDRALKEQQIAVTNERNSLLDQLRASVDTSTINRNNATADRAERVPTVKPQKPTYKVGADGSIFVIDPDDPATGHQIFDDGGNPIKAPQGQQAVVGPNGKPMLTPRGTASGATPYYPPTITIAPGAAGNPTQGVTTHGTGVGGTEDLPTVAAPRGGGASQDRINAKTALDEALKELPHPSKVPAELPNPAISNAAPGVDVRKLPVTIPNPARAKLTADSVAYESSVLGPLRAQLMAATKSPGATDATPGSPPPAPGGATAPTTTATPPATRTPGLLDTVKKAAMQAEFDAAGKALNEVLNSNLDPSLKKQAQAAYDARLARISKKYGVVP